MNGVPDLQLGGMAMMKSKRQNDILQVISLRDIETQEELAAALRSLGHNVTQATVSRDIRELRLIKVGAKGGGYKYARPENHETAVGERLSRILTDALVNVDASGNIIVIKTLSGSANVAAEALDNLGWPEILGTIAGDDTIFVATRTDSVSLALVSDIKKMMSVKNNAFTS